MVEKPWHANFPTPKSELRSLSPDEVASMMQDEQKVAGRDYVVVDVRRTDFAVPILIHRPPSSTDHHRPYSRVRDSSVGDVTLMDRVL